VSAILFEDVRFAYPGGEPVLRDISFQVPAGRRLAVLGANGAGKSTLLLHLNGLLLPLEGAVRIDDLAVRAETLREVRRRVGLVFQDPDDQLFLPTLLDDVAFAPLNDGAEPEAAEAAARDLLRSFDLLHAADRPAHHLSGGEKRLASLATTLISRPRVLVLDEPTAGLDARARQRVTRLLQQRDETLVVATHDLEVAAALCSHALVLADGRIAAHAPVRDVLGDQLLLRKHGLALPLPPHRP
jgi:cobalt/nickel transport system ATP-binding protein